MGTGTGRSWAPPRRTPVVPRAMTVLLVFLAGCGGSGEPNGLGDFSASSAPSLVAASHGPTPLAVEPTASLDTKPTSLPTPRPTAAGSFYKPPGWDGHSDVNCTDFDTHAHAQSFFEGTGGSKTNDPYGLDADHDGIACESLP